MSPCLQPQALRETDVADAADTSSNTSPAADTANATATAAPAATTAPDAAKLAADAEAAKTAEAAKVADAKPVAPDKYDFSALKLPEGIALNPALVDAVSPVLKELGLTQEGANKLVEVHAKATAELFKADEVKREADFKTFMETTTKANQDAIRKEWGTEYGPNLATAQKGMARVFDAEAKKLLDETGLGNHPSFLKAFLAVGKMVSEDTPPNGGLPTGAQHKGLEGLYTASPVN